MLQTNVGNKSGYNKRASKNYWGITFYDGEK